MRTFVGLVVAVLVVVAGCSAPIDLGGTEPTATPDRSAEPSTPRPDPSTDRLGWEDGYWYDDPLNVSTADGLDERERRAVVARTMARVEQVRQLEFERRVPVELVSREEYRNRSAGDRAHPAAFRRFDNAKFEALFLVGESEDAIAVQERNRGSNVLGAYSVENDSIVVVGGGNATLPDEATLAHELVHALQDQQFDVGSFERPTREAYNAVNGLVEGDARYVDQRYRERCGAEWDCFGAAESGGAQGGTDDLHWGVYLLNFFPYSDGPPFVAHFHARGGWDAVNALYERPPESTEQVIYPELYGQDAPRNVTLADRNANGWERVRPEGRADHAVLGQSALSTMLAYTALDDFRPASVVDRRAFVNARPDGSLNDSDPFDYGLELTRGWDGDRLHVYEKGDETAYVWKLVFDSPSAAGRFASGYHDLLSHWGGREVESTERTTVYRIDEGPFADAFALRVEGDTVVVTNAPTVDDLEDVRRGARP